MEIIIWHKNHVYLTRTDKIFLNKLRYDFKNEHSVLSDVTKCAHTNREAFFLVVMQQCRRFSVRTTQPILLKFISVLFSFVFLSRDEFLEIYEHQPP